MINNSIRLRKLSISLRKHVIWNGALRFFMQQFPLIFLSSIINLLEVRDWLVN